MVPRAGVFWAGVPRVEGDVDGDVERLGVWGGWEGDVEQQERGRGVGGSDGELEVGCAAEGGREGGLVEELVRVGVDVGHERVEKVQGAVGEGGRGAGGYPGRVCKVEALCGGGRREREGRGGRGGHGGQRHDRCRHVRSEVHLGIGESSLSCVHCIYLDTTAHHGHARAFLFPTFSPSLSPRARAPRQRPQRHASSRRSSPRRRRRRRRHPARLVRCRRAHVSPTLVHACRRTAVMSAPDTHTHRLKQFDQSAASSKIPSQAATPPTSVVGIGTKGTSHRWSCDGSLMFPSRQARLLRGKDRRCHGLSLVLVHSLACSI